jgi:hypothetical protein
MWLLQLPLERPSKPFSGAAVRELCPRASLVSLDPAKNASFTLSPHDLANRSYQSIPYQFLILSNLAVRVLTNRHTDGFCTATTLALVAVGFI